MTSILKRQFKKRRAEREGRVTTEYKFYGDTEWSVPTPRYQVDAENIVALLVYMDLHKRREGPEHEALGKALLYAVRNMDIHVMVVPFDKPPHGCPYGSAHSVHLGGHMFERHIEAFLSPSNEAFFHMLLHEWVHHMLGHCNVWTSTPTFITEYTTEQEVLRIAHEIVSLPLYEKMTRWAKDNVRMNYYRSYVHDAPEIEAWCEYKEAEQAEGDDEWNRALTTLLTSSDKSQSPF